MNPKSLLCEVKSKDGELVAVFQCESEEDFDRLKNSDLFASQIFVKVKNFRMFLGNVVIVPIDQFSFGGN